jgi:hypothetical protein
MVNIKIGVNHVNSLGPPRDLPEIPAQGAVLSGEAAE